MDESILYFSRVSLIKFSLEALSISWEWGVFILEWEWNLKRQIFPNRAFWRLDLATGFSREFKPRANGLANLGLLSCSATAGATLQLLTCLARVQTFGDLQAATHLRDPVARLCFLAHSWAFLHIFSHTTLTIIPPKYRVTNCWITSKLARNKANKMVD